jgi:hypothetical protein
MKKILQMFLDGSGDTSSKRVAAIALIISGIVGAFTKMDSVNVGILVGSGLAIFGVQATTHT